jgi:hypothetical protein
MKKLILTLLLTSLSSYSQLASLNLNLTLNNIIPVNFALHNTANTAFTVPVGKIWLLQPTTNTSLNFRTLPPGFTGNTLFTEIKGNEFYLTAGTMLYYTGTASTEYLYNIIEFNAPSTQTGTLAINEIKDIDKKIELFPNPTNSKIALNSEKNYNIEIYDMQGRIVMKDKGNTVDLSNLSNAVYILKAYDNLEKTTTSYKVVKN